MAESKPSLRTYFRSQIAISENSSVYCTSQLCPLCTSGLVTLYHPVCRVRRFAVEQSSFRHGSAIRTIGWHAICCQPLIHTAFVKGFVYHDFSYSFGPPRESDLWFFTANHKPGNVIGRLKMCRLSSIYHPVRCRNRDSSLSVFPFLGNTNNQP